MTAETENKNRVPIFKLGDINGIVYMFAGNIGNFILVAYALLGFGWSKELVFCKVIPGISIGLLIQGIYYAWMGYRLSKRENRTDVTALPSGMSTPAVFVFLFGVIIPLQYGLNMPPEKVWIATISASFVGGIIEMFGGIIGPYIRKSIPRAAMLATVAGVALVWMATKGLYDVYACPMIGIPVLVFAMVGLIGGYSLPFRIPVFPVVMVIGIICALILGVSSFVLTDVGSVSIPAFSISNVVTGFKMIVPFLAVIIPIEIYNFIETMDNVEAAYAAGDNYSVREAQFVDGGATAIAALFGGNMPNTVWLGHAGLKKSGAGIGYSLISGLMFALCGILGIFSFLYHLIPEVLIAITFLWCAITMITQAFVDSPRRYGAAIAIAFVPHIANYAYMQITGTLQTVSVDFVDKALAQKLVDSGVMWSGVEFLSNGAIITGMIWASLLVFVIDRKLDKAGHAALFAAVASSLGLIHANTLGFMPGTKEVAIGYLIVAAIFYLGHIFKDRLNVSTRFDYV